MGTKVLWRKWLGEALDTVVSYGVDTVANYVEIGYRISLLELYYEAIGAVVLDPTSVEHTHPFTCDMALNVNLTTEGSIRQQFVDDFDINKVHERLGYTLESWMALPEWKIAYNLKRLRANNETFKKALENQQGDKPEEG